MAVTVIVGVPAAVGVWLLIHVRHLWQPVAAGLRQPWGQVAAFGMALLLMVELVASPPPASSSDSPLGDGLS